MPVLLGLLIWAVSGYSQTLRRQVTVSRFAVQENAWKGSLGFSGLELRFDVRFHWNETDFTKRSFSLGYRLEQNGRVVLRSSGMEHQPASILASPEPSGNKSQMLANAEIFIPYAEIPLETGAQRADLFISLANGEGTYTDCFKTTLDWEHKKVVRHSLNDQVFDFQSINVEYNVTGFADASLGMRLSADIGLRYGPEECLDSQYELAMLIWSAGRQVYDSREASGSGERTETIPVELREGKPASATNFFVNYYGIQMDGPAEADIVFLLLGAEGGPKEVLSKRIFLNMPPKYNFEEQAFTLNSIELSPTMKDGVQGIAVHYSVGFKYTGILRNHEKGKYYFYLAVFDESEKLVIDPSRAPRHATQTLHLMDAQLPSPGNTTGEGRLFIPYYMLTTASGNHHLRYALMVSDINLGTKFPIVCQGRLDIQKPEERQYRIALDQLEMIDADYDVEFIPPGTHLPELQYLFCVGEDAFFQSEYNQNSLVAVPGGATLRLSAGDKLQMKLYDVDSGFFNDSDLQGKWLIDYAAKGDHYIYELADQGQVIKLNIKVDRQ
ncbi:MAG: hypothetical protein RLZZ165_67 [Bacteroidota bacterium]